MGVRSFLRKKFHLRAQNPLPNPEFSRFFQISNGISDSRNATFLWAIDFFHETPWNRTITWDVQIRNFFGRISLNYQYHSRGCRKKNQAT